ncbi:hypothetical protein EEL36_08795 [Muribaculaceae bacterium Isolate-043 (Harlan)]|nr:hypothetical protein EEL36_08795 [Muribaculaceae bacterium Isolate-043 (Harlan)]
MKAKIFAKLKQEYSSLGLGDEYLMSKADSLAATGLVTDDNIDAVVACQRKELEGLQKANDKRVTDALEKERKKHEEETRKKEQEAEEARRKAEEEAAAKKKGEHTDPVTNPDVEALRKQVEELTAAGKKRDEEYAANLKTLTESRDSLGKQVKELVDKNAASEAAAAKAARNAMIMAKAKELGVPQWRIDEGFTIAEDASEEVITETLTKVANNINTNILPGSRGGFPLAGNEPTKEDLASIAASLVK